jgi:hypothetical protein
MRVLKTVILLLAATPSLGFTSPASYYGVKMVSWYRLIQKRQYEDLCSFFV